LQVPEISLDSLQHHIESGRHVADFGSIVRVRYAMHEVALGDRFGGTDHVSKRSQSDANKPEAKKNRSKKRATGN